MSAAGYFIAFVLAFCLVYAGIGKLFNDGSGDGGIGKQLSTITEHQQSVTRGIGDAERAADEVAKGIGGGRETIRGIESAVERLATGEQDAGKIIADCQSILDGIRKRGKTEN